MVAEEVFIDSVHFGGPTHHLGGVITADSYGNETERRYVWNDNPIGAPGTTLIGKVLYPSLMDWNPFLEGGTPDGLTQSENLDAPQVFAGSNVRSPGLSDPHREEVRVRTEL